MVVVKKITSEGKIV